MTYLMWIDPGESTGVALGRYDDDTPYALVATWQISGGVKGFADWFRSTEIHNATEDHPSFDHEELIQGCEKFIPIQNEGHNLTLAAVEPLLVEGWLIGEGLMPRYHKGGKNPLWQRPQAMYFSSPQSLEVKEKKKRMHAWLKAHDLYVTGKTVGQPNADDARSAMAHSIAYLREIRHMPTLRHYFKE